MAWAALIFVATSLPPRALPSGPRNSDKFAHVVMYAALGALVWRAISGNHAEREPTQSVTVLWMGLAFAGCAAFGALDEWHQQYFARSTSGTDWLADVIGIGAGLVLASRPWRGRRKESVRSTSD